MNADKDLLDSLIRAGLEWIVHRLAGERTAEAIDQVDDIATTLLDGLKGNLTPDVVSTMMLQFTDALKQHDTAAEAAIKKKFDTSESGGS